jgi:hypothetical protein
MALRRRARRAAVPAAAINLKRRGGPNKGVQAAAKLMW